MNDIKDLQRRLVAVKGDPAAHAQVRQEIGTAGFPHLADELDRIAAAVSKKPARTGGSRDE